MSTSCGWEGKGRHGSFGLIKDERVGVQVKLWNPLRTRAIPERFCGGDSLYEEALYQVYVSLIMVSYRQRGHSCTPRSAYYLLTTSIWIPYIVIYIYDNCDVFLYTVFVVFSAITRLGIVLLLLILILVILGIVVIYELLNWTFVNFSPDKNNFHKVQ